MARAYDSPGGTLRATAQATDTKYASGLSGVLVSTNDPTSPLLGVFDDVGAETIPEPATSLLALAALGGAISLRRRRQGR